MSIQQHLSLDHALAAAKQRQVDLDNAIVRSLLGCWVSEVEPAICYQHGAIIGLSARGTDEITIRAPQVAL